MSDRISAYIVVLDKDYHEDDAVTILDAIGMIKGVGAVKAVTADITTCLAISRAKMDLTQKLLKALE